MSDDDIVSIPRELAEDLAVCAYKAAEVATLRELVDLAYTGGVYASGQERRASVVGIDIKATDAQVDAIKRAKGAQR